jgi:hypothetical protein
MTVFLLLLSTPPSTIFISIFFFLKKLFFKKFYQCSPYKQQEAMRNGTMRLCPLCPSCSHVRETCSNILICNHSGRVARSISWSIGLPNFLSCSGRHWVGGGGEGGAILRAHQKKYFGAIPYILVIAD